MNIIGELINKLQGYSATFDEEAVTSHLQDEIDALNAKLNVAPGTAPASTPPPVPTPAPTVSSTTVHPSDGSVNFLEGADLYVRDNSAADYLAANPNDPNKDKLEKIATQATAEWLNGGTPAQVAEQVTNAATKADGKLLVLVSYDISNRDDGGASSGGAADEPSYASWEGAVDDALNKAGNPQVVIIHEPDALGNAWNDKDYTKLSELQISESELVQHPNRSIYLDVPMWNAPSVDAMVAAVTFLITQDKMKGIRGFCLNTSGYNSDAECHTFGDAICEALASLGSFHYIVDTSRNGNGGVPGQWENVPGQKLGVNPLTQPATQYFDGNLWVKVPGESDGPNNGAPAAGQFWYDGAVALAQ